MSGKILKHYLLFFILLNFLLQFNAEITAQTAPHIADSIYYHHFKPIAMAVYEEGNKLYVFDENSDNLFVVDGISNDIVDSIKIPGAYGEMFINSTLHRLYIGNETLIYVVDVDNNILIKTLPFSLTLRNHDEIRDRIYATSGFATGKIYYVDLPTETLIKVSDEGMDPYGSMDINETRNELVIANVQYNKIRIINGNDFSERVISLADLGYPLPQPLYTTVNEKENKAYFSHSTLNCLLIIDLETESKITKGYSGWWYGSIVVDEELNKIVSSTTDFVSLFDGVTNDYINLGDFGVGDNSRFGSALLKDSHHVIMGGGSKIDILDIEHCQLIRLKNNLPSNNWNFTYTKMVINQTTGKVYYLYTDNLHYNEGMITIIEDGEIQDNWTVRMGSSFPPFPEPQSLRAIWFNDPLLGWIVGSQGSILQTEDGGMNWNSQNSGTTMELSNVFFTNSQTGWCVGNNSPYMTESVLLKTTNGGNDWINLQLPFAGNLYGVFFINNQIGWIRGRNSQDYKYTIARTTDGGQTWIITKTFSSFIEDIFFIDELNGWAAVDGYSNGFYKTSDGGYNWIRVSSSLGLDYAYSIFFTDKNNGWASGRNSLGTVNSRSFHTSNGGLSWETQLSYITTPGRTYDYIRDFHFLDSLNGWAISEGGQILNTSDGGINWNSKKFSGTGTYALSRIFMNNLNNGWVVGTGNSKAVLYYNSLPIPAYPTNLIATAISHDKVQLIWNDNSNNETGFEILRSDFYSGNYKKIATIPTGSLSYEDTAVTPESTYWYRVQAFNATGYSGWSREDSSITLPAPAIYKDICIHKDWNIISIPLLLNDMSLSTVFPFAISEAFEYNNGYINTTTFENGKGYWLKFNSEDSVIVNGVKSTGNIPLSSGWNIIGVADVNLPIDEIYSNPTDIFTSSFYGYNNGYVTATTLESGKGYWVKTNQAGYIVYPALQKNKTINNLEITINKEWPRIELTDANNRKGILYLTNSGKDLNKYELPPLPPKGIFDFRFTTDRYVEELNSASKEIKISSAEYPVKLKIVGTELKVSDLLGGKVINVLLKDGETITINNSAIEILRIEGKSVPTEFALYQNYPNPFNPVTKIKYAIPVDSKVRIAVYNLLGEEVREIVNQNVSAGYNEIEFNASDLSSGLYLYRIEANAMAGKDHFISVKKMLVIK